MIRFTFIGLLFLTILLTVDSSNENKYSKEANDESNDNVVSDKDSRDFRTQKINTLWQKGKKRLTGKKLKNLKSDLKLQDKEELALKKLKYEDYDKFVVKEKKIRASLESILDKYGLKDIYDDAYHNNIKNEL